MRADGNVKRTRKYLRSGFSGWNKPKSVSEITESPAEQEAEFSPLDMVFVMKHMNRRGLDAAYMQFCIYCILLWQIALSALKVNRENLIMKATAFNDLNPRAP